MHQVGNVARLGQAVGERGLVDQEFRAAVGQHIGDFRLLLAGAEQDRDGAEMRRAEQRQHEFDAVAEQERDAIAASHADPAQTRRDLRRLPRDLAPAHPPLAAHQRLAVGIARRGRTIIAQMLAGRSQNAGTTRSPKRVSCRMAGMEYCDQSIAASYQLFFMP